MSDDVEAGADRGLRQALRWCRSPIGVKLFRYVMGSVITTIVSFGVLTLVYGVLRWWSAVPSTVFANVVATIPAYWLNRTWTWGKSGRSDPWREVIPFWVLSLIGIVISMGTATLASNMASAHHLGHLADLAAVDGANLMAYGVLFVGKYLVFDRLFRAAEAARTAAVAGRGVQMPGTARPAWSARIASVPGTARPARSARIASVPGTARPARSARIASVPGTARPVGAAGAGRGAPLADRTSRFAAAVSAFATAAGFDRSPRAAGSATGRSAGAGNDAVLAASAVDDQAHRPLVASAGSRRQS